MTAELSARPRQMRLTPTHDRMKAIFLNFGLRAVAQECNVDGIGLLMDLHNCRLVRLSDAELRSIGRGTVIRDTATAETVSYN